MLSGLGSLGLFFAKALIIVILALFMVVVLLIIASKAKEKQKGHLVIRKLNEKLDETREELLEQTLSKDEFKQFKKERKQRLKEEKKNPVKKPCVFALNFHGDIQASDVSALQEEITAILTIATPKDEVVVKIESGGGMVHAYGLGAAELQRIRDKHIPLTICVDKIAASGGYLMAAVGNRILAAPFAIIGSIGVVFQMPNFHRVLQDKHVESEFITAANYKRTLPMFGKNTEEGRDKLREELEDIHKQFKGVIQEYRPELDIARVSTGEHWLAKHALDLKLVDDLMTSDAYLIKRSESAHVYEVHYECKKSLGSKLKMAMQHWMQARSMEPLLPRA